MGHHCGVSDGEPSSELRAIALARVQVLSGVCVRQCGVRGLIMIAALVVAVFVAPLRVAALIAAGVAGALGVVYVLAVRRYRVGSGGIGDGPYRPVRVAGWCRPSDGCNYGVFDADSTEMSDPRFVVRLTLRREMFDGLGWLCGRPDAGAVGLIGFDGSLLGVGYVVDQAKARRIWTRRNKPVGRFVQRPPKDWFPPGGG